MTLPKPTLEIQQILQEKLSGHKIEVISENGKHKLKIDDREMKVVWTEAAHEDLKVFHGAEASNELVDMIVDEIKRQLEG